MTLPFSCRFAEDPDHWKCGRARVVVVVVVPSFAGFEDVFRLPLSTTTTPRTPKKEDHAT